MKLHINLVIQIIGVIIIILYFIFSALFVGNSAESQAFKGLNINVYDSTRATFIDKQEIENMIRKSGLLTENMPVNDINTEELELYLKKNPVIKSAECYKTVEGKIDVDIRQRIPVLRVMSGTGNYYVDNEGYIMPVSINYSVHVPLASGAVSKEFAQNTLFPFALYLQKNKFWDAQISQIYVYPNQDISLIPRVGEHEIILGDTDNLDEKMEKLMTFYKEALNEMGWNRYAKISLKYDNQVVCTKK